MIAFVVHDLPQAVAALTAAADCGRPVVLLSPPEAARSLGIGGFLGIVRTAQQAVPTAQGTAHLDCGAAPGLAMAALAAGIGAVSVEGPPIMLAKLAEIAARCGGRVAERPSGAVDLARAADPLAMARQALMTGQ